MVPAPSRIKIFYLITGLHIGGAEKSFLELTRNLDFSRYEPVVGTLVGGTLIPQFEAVGIKVYDFGMRHKLDFGAVLRLIRAIRKERPHILHTRLIHADNLGRIVGRICGIPAIVSTIPMVEDARHKWFVKTIDRWTSRFADVLIALSERVKRELVSVEGLDSAKFEVIPNGVRRDQLPDPERAARMRATLRLPSGAYLLGVISRLEAPRKGHHILFQALARLAERYPQLHCVVIGDGPARLSLEAQAGALGLSDRVHFVGEQQDIDAWLGALDLFVLPSLLEGFPMAIVEALAAARPIIATATAGVPDLINDGVTGRLVEPGNVEQLAGAIEEIASDRNYAAKLAAQARQQFEAHFDMRSITRRIESLYERLSAAKCRKLRVLEVVTAVDEGGVTTYLENLVSLLPRDSFEVEIASGAEQFEPGVIRRLGVPHHMVSLVKPVDLFHDLRAVWQVYRVIRRGGFDMVHTNMSKADIVGGIAAKLAGVPSVSTAHGILRLALEPKLQHRFYGVIEWMAYRWLLDWVISVSQATTAVLSAEKGVSKNRVTTIPNTVRAGESLGVAGRASVRAELGLGPQQPVIGMVSRLVPLKAPEVLIESVRFLRYQWPSIRCLIVGEGPRRPELEALIVREKLGEWVKLLGHRRQASTLLPAFDVFVLASYTEGMSIAVLEAMAAGIPVVASRIDGMDELVEHGQTGLLVDENEPRAFAEAIGRVLAEVQLRNMMAQATRERSRTIFDSRVQVERTQEVFLNLSRRAVAPPCLRLSEVLGIPRQPASGQGDLNGHGSAVETSEAGR